jgi:twitching motility two-component system response regulator PilG
MQGTISEIDLNTVINLIELGQRTGELLIESSGGKFWFLFFDKGQIIYATDAETNLIRLRNYLSAWGLNNALDRLATSKLGLSVLEYGQIWALLEADILSPAQAKSILENIIREVLFDILSLYQGAFVFEISPALTPKLTSFKFSQISSEYSRQLREWKQFAPILQSIHQSPILIANEALPHLRTWINGNNTIRQLSRYSGLDICQVGHDIYNALISGEVAITPSATSLVAKVRVEPLKILCIDDSQTICRAVEYILQNHGYQIMAISSPIKALSLIFQQKPDLVLCDISMPELNGYELCGMLRKSTAFAKIPIIMLTGKDSFIDRVKARMVGATEYLTKPFGEKELLTTVEKYIGLTQNN